MLEEVISPHEAKQYSPLTLAFLGDGVYELLVREKIVTQCNRPVNQLHHACVAYVKAQAQSAAYGAIEGLLTADERQILLRGRNASGHTSAKNADIGDYRRATAVEALFGYLYLTGQKARIGELFGVIWKARPDASC